MINEKREAEITGFQDIAPYDPKIDIRTDFIMVYGVDDSLPERVKEWRDKGYVIHLMTGIAWGEYQDYLYGKYDGIDHWDEAQKDRKGQLIEHGEDTPYMVPTLSFANYLAEQLKVAVDVGVQAIHLEEPEFWVHGGYSEAFKREWQEFYKEPWAAPHESVDAEYRSSKLKAYLYRRCLDLISTRLKAYAKEKHQRELRFYVPTHSLINYTQWKIVSPQSQLIDLPNIDGYIAQVWTGTSRVPNVYHGVKKERTFETAYLEYGVMQELARGTNRDMWFLHDPIEDDPSYDWGDYQKNYYQTVVASLFHPDVYRYEVSPWPHRIFDETYQKKDGSGEEPIPAPYATNLLTIMNTLRDFKQSEITWEGDMKPIGIFLSDTAMYQRNYPTGDDTIEHDHEKTEWSAFYGLALPLLKAGIPVRPLQLDNIKRFTDYLNAYQTILLSYEFMKPSSPDFHEALKKWILTGGQLIYVGDGKDEFHQVREWWNREEGYENPAEHLFQTLGLGENPVGGNYNVGEGSVSFLPMQPKDCATDIRAANLLKDTVRLAVQSAEQDSDINIWEEKNYLLLRRGPYVICSVFAESIHNKPLELKGLYVNLFDHRLPIMREIIVHPGEQILLYDLSVGSFTDPVEVIATSARVEEVAIEEEEVKMLLKGPAEVQGVTRLRCVREPNTIEMKNHQGEEMNVSFEWDEISKTVLVSYDHCPKGISMVIKWKE